MYCSVVSHSAKDRIDSVLYIHIDAEDGICIPCRPTWRLMNVDPSLCSKIYAGDPI